MDVNNQINQVVVGGNDGSAFIAWQDYRNGTNYNIYAQRASDSGVLLWNDTVTGKLICGGSSQKENLSMVAVNDGGAIIAWQDSRNGNTDIYAQWIDSSGEIAMGWPVSGLAISVDPSVQSPPKMVKDGNGGAFVVWSDNRGGDYDIHVRHILFNGTLGAEKSLQLAPEDMNQINPAITSDGDHGAIIAYEQYNGANWDIYAQRIDALNQNMWIDGGVPACIAANDQKNPSLVNDSVGSAIIVWEDNVNFTWDIYAQRVGSVPPTGAIQWTANGVAIMAIALDQIHPVIVAGAQYTAFIAWEHYLSATDSNIYVHKIFGGAAGTTPSLPWVAPIAVSTLHDSYQRNPQAVSDGSGGVIIAYETGENLAANGYDIYANHINQAGNFDGAGVAGGYIVCTWDTDQTKPMLAYSATAANGVIYAWLDKRNEPAAGIHDIYTLGTIAPEEYTFSITSHDENDLLGPDLNAEIYFNGSPFAIPVYTSYVFGAPGNLPFLSGVYSVVKAGWTGWLPPSVTIVADHNDTQDFLAHVDTLPVELSSFSAVLTAQNFVKLTWVSQSETNLLGYRVYRGLNAEFTEALLLTPSLIGATNTSTQHIYNYTDNQVETENTYSYWLESVDYNSNTLFGPVTVHVLGNQVPELPEVTVIGDAYPNPFKTQTSFTLSVKAGETASVKIYNILGQVIRTYIRSEGSHTLSWDGRDFNNNACGSGIYFYRVQSPTMSQTKRMVIVK
ncbi:MAG TPA: T9SS type A sorting domain-containing protein [Candidatus Cloacimonadota bacterium]|nr:T9SS type A sorting domain-containing protein [Candidatus Cloacimonadota bacterium]